MQSYGKEKLYSEIQREFDKYNVSEHFEDGLKAFDFRGINGNQYFPHVYIPFFEEHSNTRKNSMQLPVIVIEDILEEVDAIPGYTLDKEGRFVQMDTLITEAYAQEHEVWVIAFNERVEKLEDVEKLKQEKLDQPSLIADNSNASGSYGYSYKDKCNDGTNAFIPQDGIEVKAVHGRVTSHKESWFRGASEVHIKLASTSGEGTPGSDNYWTLSLQELNDPYGGGQRVVLPRIIPEGEVFLKKVSRSSIRNEKGFSMNVALTRTTWYLADPFASYRLWGDGIYYGTRSWKSTYINARIEGRNITVEDDRHGFIVWAIFEKDTGAEVGLRTSETVQWRGTKRPDNIISLPQEIDLSGKVQFQSRDGEYRVGYFSADVYDSHYPCGFSTFSSPDHTGTFFNFETEKGFHSATFPYANQ